MPRSIEAFAAYHRQKEDLAGYLQVASAGIGLLRRNLNVPNGPELLGALVDACEVSHWGKGKRYSGAEGKVDAARDALANQGIIQQVAAFDLFTRSLVQDIARFSSRARREFVALRHNHDLLKFSPAERWVSNHCCNDVAGRLGKLSIRLEELQSWIGWHPSAKLVPTLSLFDLVRSIRNGIAHNGELVGADLEEISASRKTVDALTAFRKYTRGDLPGLPSLSRGKRIKLEVVHAILFGAFLYEVAKELNEYAVGLLTDGELIDMAFFYSCILDEHPFRTIMHKSAESRVCHYLSSRYMRQAKGLGPTDVIAHLSRQTLQDKNCDANSTYWRVAMERHVALSERR